jgi:recombination protein RecT
MAKPPATTQNRPIDTFKQHLTLAMPTLRHMIPQHVTPEKFQAMVVTAVAYDKNLLECSTESLIRETAQAAELGLSLNKSLREADILTVFSGGSKQAQMRPRYMGLMKLARQSGEIKDIYAHVVHADDEFDYEYGLDRYLKHKPCGSGDVTHAYCVWVLKDGTKAFEVIDRAALDKIRDRSEGYKAFKAGKIKSTPWESDFEEMCRKTAVRRASKYMPISNEAWARAVALDDRADASEDSRAEGHEDYHGSFGGDVVDVTPDTPSAAATSQTETLADRVAPMERLEVPDEFDGPDYETWGKRAVEVLAGLAPSARGAWMKVHANILRDAPAAVRASVEGVVK